MVVCRCADGSYAVQAVKVGAPRGRRAYVLRLGPRGAVAAVPLELRPRLRSRGRPGRAEALLTALLLASAFLDVVSSRWPSLLSAAGYGAAIAAMLGGLLGYAHLKSFAAGVCGEGGLIGQACAAEVQWARASSVEGPYRGRRGYVYRVGVGDSIYEVRLSERDLRELEAAGVMPA